MSITSRGIKVVATRVAVEFAPGQIAEFAQALFEEEPRQALLLLEKLEDVRAQADAALEESPEHQLFWQTSNKIAAVHCYFFFILLRNS